MNYYTMLNVALGWFKLGGSSTLITWLEEYDNMAGKII